MTKQMRAYAETVDFIAELVSQKPKGTTFADVVDEMARLAYPDLYDQVMKAKTGARKLIADALHKSEGE